MAADGDINTPDRPADQDALNNAWGFRDDGGATADAIRDFNTPLTIGSTFSIQMDNGFLDSGNSMGFGLQTTSGTPLFEFFFTGGNSSYTYQDETGFHSTTIGFADEGLDLDFTLTGTDSYSFTATRKDGVTQTVSGDLIGAVDGAVGRFRGFYFGSNGADSHIGFFNSMQINAAVPEPTMAAMLGLGGFIIWFRRRRAKLL